MLIKKKENPCYFLYIMRAHTIKVNVDPKKEKLTLLSIHYESTHNKGKCWSTNERENSRYFPYISDFAFFVFERT